MTTRDPGPIARRLREIRREQYGERGLPALAEELGLPPRTLENYESGVSMPAHILLAFLRATGAHPRWLLDGRGPRYLRPDSPAGRLGAAGGGP